MRAWLQNAAMVGVLTLVAQTTPVAAQDQRAITREQTNRTTETIQNQIRQAVKPHLAAGAIQDDARSGRPPARDCAQGDLDQAAGHGCDSAANMPVQLFEVPAHGGERR